jgi:hypothetical protein
MSILHNANYNGCLLWRLNNKDYIYLVTRNVNTYVLSNRFLRGGDIYYIRLASMTQYVIFSERNKVSSY